MPLFSRVRRIGILGSSFAARCIHGPRGVRGSPVRACTGQGGAMHLATPVYGYAGAWLYSVSGRGYPHICCHYRDRSPPSSGDSLVLDWRFRLQRTNRSNTVSSTAIAPNSKVAYQNGKREGDNGRAKNGPGGGGYQQNHGVLCVLAKGTSIRRRFTGACGYDLHTECRDHHTWPQ